MEILRILVKTFGLKSLNSKNMIFISAGGEGCADPAQPSGKISGG